MRRLKNTAIKAITASTDRDDRRPVMRAVAFSSTIAFAVCVGTPALSSAVFRSASETNGHPAGEFDLGFGLDLGGHRGVVLDTGHKGCGEGGDQHGAGERGADRRAEVRDRVLEAADLAALLDRAPMTR